jgi:hypothetical protein
VAPLIWLRLGGVFAEHLIFNSLPPPSRNGAGHVEPAPGERFHPAVDAFPGTKRPFNVPRVLAKALLVHGN